MAAKESYLRQLLGQRKRVDKRKRADKKDEKGDGDDQWYASTEPGVGVFKFWLVSGTFDGLFGQVLVKRL